MKFNINIIILPATRFVLLKLTTVAHSSQFKSFFIYCSFSIIGPYPLSRLCYAIYCVPGADTMVSNLHFCERPDLVIKIRGIQSTIKIAVAFPQVSSVTSPLLYIVELIISNHPFVSSSAIDRTRVFPPGTRQVMGFVQSLSFPRLSQSAKISFRHCHK